MAVEAKSENQVIKLQDQSFMLLKKIQKHREEVKYVKLTNGAVVAEALSLLAEKEFAE